MDNKITKKRLSHLLSYEWIAIIAVIIACIALFEFIYSIAGVRLDAGQQFKIYYDQNVLFTNSDRLYTHLQEKNTFSFGVVEVDIEDAKEEFNVINYRTRVAEGDIVITDDFLSEEEGASKYVRAKSLIDSIGVYKLDQLLEDAKEYLKGFLIDESDESYNESNFSREKIESNFRKRVKGNNSYRKEKDLKKGIEQEIQRILRLSSEVKDFEKVLTLPDEYFFSYTRLEQAYITTDEKQEPGDKANFLVGLKTEKARNKEKYGTETARYGLRLDKFQSVEGKFNTAEFFKMVGETTSKNTLILVFDFKDEQPDLQYETIFFVNQIVRSFSDILD